MTAEEFAARLEILIEDARQGGLPTGAIIAGLEAASEALYPDSLRTRKSPLRISSAAILVLG